MVTLYNGFRARASQFEEARHKLSMNIHQPMEEVVAVADASLAHARGILIAHISFLRIIYSFYFINVIHSQYDFRRVGRPHMYINVVVHIQ